MSGWTFDVTITQVKRKSKTVQVRAFSQDQAIEYAKLAAVGIEWETHSKDVEYQARELT